MHYLFFTRRITLLQTRRATQYLDLQLTDEEFTGVLEFIKRTCKEGKMHVNYCCEVFLGNYEGEVWNHFFSCNAGLSVGSFLVNGSISACPSICSDFHQGNIYKDNFMDVWEHRFQDFRNRK